MQGYARLIEARDYIFPRSHHAQIEALSADSDSVRYFLTAAGTGLNWGAENAVGFTDLHTKYWSFMVQTGSGPVVKINKLVAMMKELSGILPFNIENTEDRGIEYRGVGI
jgi:hypothetical protein